MSAHLKERSEDEVRNADRRETLVGNAILDYLRDGGSRKRLAEILTSLPPDKYLPDFFEDDDPENPRNRLTELLQKIPVVDLP